MADSKATRTGQGGADAGILYVVATPVGNPGDITLRALEVLGEVDLVACEDTRRTGAMLASRGLRKPLVSYFEHNEQRRIPELVRRLQDGEKVALVTDAGTPGISDPGFRLVRAAHQAGVHVTAVPGASALLAALSIAGLPTDRFVFEGFLPPRDSARRRALESLKTEGRTIVFFEAARRLLQTLLAMADVMGREREAAVVREVTKLHEETVHATIGELCEHFGRKEALGEVTIVVQGAAGGGDKFATGESPAVTVDALVEAGLSLKQASAVMAKLTGMSRRELYNEALRARRPGSGD